MGFIDRAFYSIQTHVACGGCVLQAGMHMLYYMECTTTIHVSACERIRFIVVPMCSGAGTNVCCSERRRRQRRRRRRSRTGIAFLCRIQNAYYMLEFKSGTTE